MSRGSHIVAVGGEQAPAFARETGQVEAEAKAQPAEDILELEDALPPQRSWAWLMPAAALLSITAWTAFFVWTERADILSPAPLERWAGWISAWSQPVLLICVLWLLAMRNSRREAGRFGGAAMHLAQESARLEGRLVNVNHELSLAREFLAAQSRDLDALGRMATERLSKNADRLQELIHENGAQLEGISTVSATALDNMERLRGQLPVIASTAKDVTNNIANAGRTAHAQLQEMVHGFNRLNDFGQASDRQVNLLRQKVDESLTEFARHAEQLDEIAKTRFAALAENGKEFREQLDSQEVEALAGIRNRATALTEELDEARDVLERHEAESLTSLRARLSSVRDESGAIARALRETEDKSISGWRQQLAQIEEDLRSTHALLEQSDSQAMQAARGRLDALVQQAQRFDASLEERSRHFAEELVERRKQAEELEASAMALTSERLEELDREILRRRERHQQDSATLAAHSQAIAVQLAELETRISAIAAHGGDAEAKLSTSLKVLADRLVASRDALAGTDSEIAALTDASVRLLELIQAGAQHSREDLPAAIASGENRLQAVKSQVFALRDAVNEAGDRSEGLSSYVLAAGDAVRSSMDEMDALHDRIDERSQAHVRQLEELRQRLVAIGGESTALAASARTELSTAIEHLTHTAREAVMNLDHQGAEAVSEIARKLAEESRHIIDRVMHDRAAEVGGQLEQAVSHAAGVSREAAMQLRDQLAKVQELTGNLEQRVAHARQRAEEQVDNDFARRVALITESLNSNSIDIAKALSNDVSDTAWSAYLRGDRGIFTRRAVSLLDSTEARSVAQLYENDREFGEHVNRYIHDFEAMLRQLLSTRDGHALGVTLLSSDMGKLYVALAQGIERLRN